MDSMERALADVATTIGEALTVCLERGMTLPFVLAAVHPNSSVFCLRYEENEAGEGLTAVPLADHTGEGDGFALPINIMITDQTGEAVRVTITQDGMTTYH